MGWAIFWANFPQTHLVTLFVTLTPARCPAFPPSLYNYVNEHSDEKHMVLILNKVDLVPAGLALAWKDYFEHKFSNLKVSDILLFHSKQLNLKPWPCLC
jgi:ribosome biogenesis GTPase A